MSVNNGARLSIFARFKNKTNQLTGEAKRQRTIIAILASNAKSTERTRISIAQKMAEIHNLAWKNLYSGVFHAMDRVFLPMQIIEEKGRLPLKRGPKALQEKGIPYYNLTKKGILVALGISEIDNKQALFDEFFLRAEPAEKEFEDIITVLLKASPDFTYSIFQKYVQAFCDNQITDLVPFNLLKLKDLHDGALNSQKQILKDFFKLSKKDRTSAIKFLDEII